MYNEGEKMTRDEFLDLQPDTPTPLVIQLRDGRMGLCSHWTQTEIIVDAHPRANDSEQVRVPFSRVAHLGGSLLSEIAPTADEPMSEIETVHELQARAEEVARRWIADPTAIPAGTRIAKPIGLPSHRGFYEAAAEAVLGDGYRWKIIEAMTGECQIVITESVATRR
jgi:hypothetical protein